MTVAFVGVGSNVEREYHARKAVTELAKLGEELRVSAVYDCASVDFDSAPFFNFVVQLSTSMTLQQFSSALRQIEFAYGREEDAKKYQDRTLDLDIILFGEQVSAASPQVPRDDIYKYPFVIQPLYELCPDLTVPADGRTVKELWLEMDSNHSLTKVDFPFDGF